MTPSRYTQPCHDLVDLRARLAELEKDVAQNSQDIRLLLEFMAGVKMLMYLSVGGGGLSIISLIITIAEGIRNAAP